MLKHLRSHFRWIRSWEVEARNLSTRVTDLDVIKTIQIVASSLGSGRGGARKKASGGGQASTGIGRGKAARRGLPGIPFWLCILTECEES